MAQLGLPLLPEVVHLLEAPGRQQGQAARCVDRGSELSIEASRSAILRRLRSISET